MKHWSSRQLIALFLGVFLALGMSLPAVQAGEMAAQMTMAGDAGGQGDCDDCGGNGGDGARACSLVLSCANMAAVLPVERGLVASHAAKVFIPLSSAARDLSAPPDPYPPRSRDLG